MDEVYELLKRAELPVVPYRIVGDVESAATAAAVLGFPVVVKAIRPGVVHKMRASAVVLNVSDQGTLGETLRRLERQWGPGPYLVQPQVNAGVEWLLGAVRDQPPPNGINQSVPIATDTDQHDLYFRGTHKPVKVPTQSSDPIVAIVAQFVGRYRADIALTVTDLTLGRIAEVNRVTSTLHLIDLIGTNGGEQRRDTPAPIAFLVSILDAHTDSNLAIRALHNLYYLVVARKHGVHVLELAQELPSILASGGEFEKLIQSFTLVPEAFRTL